MTNSHTIEDRIGTLEDGFIRLETRAKDKWGDVDDHEGRIRELETFKNKLAGKLALSSGLGALLGSGLIAGLIKLMG